MAAIAQRWIRKSSPRRSYATGYCRRLQLEPLAARMMLAADVLYVGDGGNDSVQRFNAETGAWLGSLVPAGTTGLHGPRGLIVDAGKLLLINQNAGTVLNGEVLVIDRATGVPQTAIVPASNPLAPFAPRGILRKDNTLFVADFEGATHPRIAKYNATSGAYMGELIPSGFNAEFRPRGIVFGPDGGLYVSVFSETSFYSADPAGYILRLDANNGSYRMVAKNNGDGIVQSGELSGLHNPEGIVFGPAGQLYVTSNASGQNGSILMIDPASGVLLDSITLDAHTKPENPTQVAAQSLLFGPAGKLFIPVTITSLNDGTDSGGVWIYDPLTKQLDTSFVVPSYYSDGLVDPWYLTFGQTNPATLRYQPWHNFVNALDVDNKGYVAPLDVLLVINELNNRHFINAEHRLPYDRAVDADFLDVTNDGLVTALDVLWIVNHLNGLPPSGEGEATLEVTSSALEVNPMDASARMQPTELRRTNAGTLAPAVSVSVTIHGANLEDANGSWESVAFDSPWRRNERLP